MKNYTEKYGKRAQISNLRTSEKPEFLLTTIESTLRTYLSVRKLKPIKVVEFLNDCNFKLKFLFESITYNGKNTSEKPTSVFSQFSCARLKGIDLKKPSWSPYA